MGGLADSDSQQTSIHR